ncbi:amidase domain-containing protein [Amycolatopsis sp. 195334CR]|uniref:amidase domain-containing protein n=1 Tax=Amycolatopsis sp. 195334CR TaxID=2814588 RepID=UPI001A8EC442|nr:amidase domain-containing protein [Amycolatopsis sp. 195334CR]MBN6034021.1 amidase domain-containing protein [Amycolatopsis sp. 195334CR]
MIDRHTGGRGRAKVVGMVTFQQLKAAKPATFATAADDWLKLAKEAETAAENLYERGGNALGEQWSDTLGEKAGGHCRKIAQDFQAAGMAIRGVVTTLDGLATALAAAKRNLESAVAFATEGGLEVGGDGKVTVPSGSSDPKAEERAKRAGWLIWDAVNDATKIDEDAAASLKRLIQPASITKLMTQDELAKDILNDEVKKAGHTGLAMLRQTMPLNADAQTQAEWWKSLSQDQRKQYLNAAPVQLYDMPGIPDDVKKNLMGNDGLNRIEMIRWAEKHGESGYSDVPGMENCTNFVSYAMNEGGMVPHDKTGDKGWNQDHQGLPKLPFVGSPDQYRQGDAWAAAQNHHDYMVKNGGESVTVPDARPGDLLYMRNEKGVIHHASVITAVTPDGEILYTQHNSNHTNIGLNHRLSHNETRTGAGDVPLVVRPHPNWD